MTTARPYSQIRLSTSAYVRILFMESSRRWSNDPPHCRAFALFFAVIPLCAGHRIEHAILLVSALACPAKEALSLCVPGRQKVGKDKTSAPPLIMPYLRGGFFCKFAESSHG